MENSQSRFGAKTLNMMNKHQLGSGPSKAHLEPVEEQEGGNFDLLGQVHKHIAQEVKCENFKTKMSTDKYQEGIFKPRPLTKLPNLIMRNAEGKLTPNVSQINRHL
jgi:ubiquinone biosynthesis protein Coq4